MKQFDFVFLIALSLVNTTSSLAETVKSQMGLSDVPALHLESILEGKTDHKVLLILDGYNEYKPGTNRSVDKAIAESNANRYTILTCCHGDYDDNDVDAVVAIKGFASKISAQWLGSFLEAPHLIKKMVREYGELLETVIPPLKQFMLAAVSLETNASANTFVNFLDIVCNVILERAAIQNFQCKLDELEKRTLWLNILNEISWEALQKDSGQYLLCKVTVVNFATYKLD